MNGVVPASGTQAASRAEDDIEAGLINRKIQESGA